MELNLLDLKKNIFSQNGEDGIIEKIFEIINPTYKVCCEFGAWDGIHFSNTRNLILQGWIGIMIEGDAERYKALASTYKNFDRVYCINKFVDDNKNNLYNLFSEIGIKDLYQNLDFLSIDIDGLDFEIFRSLDSFPKVICVEVNAGHDPNNPQEIKAEVAQNNVGQPLHLFSKIAEEKGYALCCYNGNAFYIRRDLAKKHGLPVLSNEEAYSNFLDYLSVEEKEWLYVVNIGLVPPYHKFKNPYLKRKNLDIGFFRAFELKKFYKKQRKENLKRQELIGS